MPTDTINDEGQKAPPSIDARSPGRRTQRAWWTIVFALACVITLWLILRNILGASLWANLLLGFAINFGLLWSLLLARDLVRRRRLDVVVYLAKFLAEPSQIKDGVITKTGIAPASLRLALEKYMIDFDGVGTTSDNISAEINANKVGQDIDTYEGILKWTKQSFDRERLWWFRVRMFFAWFPALLPFAFLAAAYSLEFSPIKLVSDGLPNWMYDWFDWSVRGPGDAFVDAAAGGFWTLGIGVRPPSVLADTLLVSSFAFAGAYAHAWRDFIRGVVSFDLSPATVLRAFRHAVTAILVTVVAYHALSPIKFVYEAPAIDKTESTPPNNPTGNAESTPPSVQDTETGGKKGSGTRKSTAEPGAIFWLAIAFAIGFYPDLGLSMVLRQVQLGTMKRTRESAYLETETIPLEILDGIDFDVRARMEEFGITDVQHLATSNPILLFVETPYFSLLQAIDWVAQAQLCTAVGPDAFIRLRQWRIRTVFDLERAVLGPHDVDQYRCGVVTALIETSPQAAAIQRTLGGSASVDVKVARAIGEVLLDDLHVLRLRQIWKIIRDRLGPDATALFEPPPIQSPLRR